MAKRLTETMKWEDRWFMGLSPQYKLLWLYICDKCDHAGMWECNQRLAEFQIGETYNWDEVRIAFKDQVQVIVDKWHIPSFVEFQYGKLNPAVRVHKAVMNRLSEWKRKGYEGVSKGLYNSCLTPKEKEKEKDIDKDKDIEEYIENTKSSKNKDSPPLEAELKDLKGLTPLQKVVTAWKELEGVALDDKAWDRLNWSRCSRTGNELLRAMNGDYKAVIDCMESVRKELIEKNLSYTIETIKKRAYEWMEENGKLANSRE